MGPAPASNPPDSQPLQEKPMFLDMASDLPGETPKAVSSSSAVSPVGTPTTPTTFSYSCHPTSHSMWSTPSPSSPLPSTSPSTTFHHRRNASSSNRSRATNPFAVAAGLYWSCTEPWARLLAPSWKQEPHATSSTTGPVSQHNADKQTDSTVRRASIPRNGSYRDHKTRFSSPRATPSSPLISCSAPSDPHFA